MRVGRPGFGLVAAVVFGHGLVNAFHGVPHVAVPVPLLPWQGAFVGAVAGAAPFVGLALVWWDRSRLGGAAMALGGAGSLVFATYYHFRSTTPDNVANVTGQWSLPFLATSVGISVLAAATAVVGVWLLLDGASRAD